MGSRALLGAHKAGRWARRTRSRRTWGYIVDTRLFYAKVGGGWSRVVETEVAALDPPGHFCANAYSTGRLCAAGFGDHSASGIFQLIVDLYVVVLFPPGG